MGLLDNIFKKRNEVSDTLVFQRANLFQKNIASNIETDSLEIAISCHHSLVSISDKLFSVKTLNGQLFSIPIQFSEKDISTTTHVGSFKNGGAFRLIQPTELSLFTAKSTHNALGAFSLGSVNPNGWAVHFFLTAKDDLRQTTVLEKGVPDQIQKLIHGSMMSIKFGIPGKFFEFSKLLLQMIESNPSQLNDFQESEEFIQMMNDNLQSYTSREIAIIKQI